MFDFSNFEDLKNNTPKNLYTIPPLMKKAPTIAVIGNPSISVSKDWFAVIFDPVERVVYEKALMILIENKLGE